MVKTNRSLKSPEGLCQPVWFCLHVSLSCSGFLTHCAPANHCREQKKISMEGPGCFAPHCFVKIPKGDSQVTLFFQEPRAGHPCSHAESQSRETCWVLFFDGTLFGMWCKGKPNGKPSCLGDPTGPNVSELIQPPTMCPKFGGSKLACLLHSSLKPQSKPG